MGHRVTLIPGDGTGPELTEATRRVTYDLKPSQDDPSAVGASEFADAIIAKLAASGELG